MADLYTDSAFNDKEYRYMLKQASDSLSKRNITTIKFLCSDYIAASRLEKIKSGIAIWTELEDKCLLSSKDYSLLTEILYHAERRDLIKQLTNTNADAVHMTIKEGNGRLPHYRVFLNKLCQEIPQRHLEEVKYLFTADLSNSAREGATDMWMLILLLERQDIIAPGKLTCLGDIINIIGRKDLFDMISDYKATYGNDEGVDDAYLMMNYDEEKLMESSDISLVDLRSTSGEYTPNTSPSERSTSTSQHTSSAAESTPIQATEDHTGASVLSSSNLGRISDPIPEQYHLTGINPRDVSHAPSMYSSDVTHLQNRAGASRTVDNAAVPHMQIPQQVPQQDPYTSNSSSELMRYPTSGIHYQELSDEASTPPLYSDMAGMMRSSHSANQHHQQQHPETRGANSDAIAEVLHEAEVSTEAPPDVDEGLVSLVLPSYKMTSVPRGFCIIINNKEFTRIAGDKKSKKLSDRPGSDVDAEKLMKTFTWLGFKVLPYTNCSVKKMNAIFQQMVVGNLLDKSDALVVCVLSHGVFGAIYGSQGYEMKIGQIISYFKPDSCPSMAHKPKIFFVAACQGKEKQLAAHLPAKLHTDDATTELDDDLPKDADFLIGYATVPGFVSYRHEDNGTWYIRTLVDRLNKWARKEDLMAIMTDVNRIVAQHSAPDGSNTYKQMPLPYTTLTKKIFLKPIYESPGDSQAC